MTQQDDIEAQIQALEPVALSGMEAHIAMEQYFTAMDGVCGREMTIVAPCQPLELLTFCVLVLKNGSTVTGESACACPEDFDADSARKRARQNAVLKLYDQAPFDQWLQSKAAASMVHPQNGIQPGPAEQGDQQEGWSDDGEIITFEKLVLFGISSRAPLINGMPWAFQYKGLPVSHETDGCYLIGTGGVHFYRGKRLKTYERQHEGKPVTLFEILD